MDNRYLDIIKLTVEQSTYAIWWSISNEDQRFMKKCEIMIKLLCHASLLKGDNSRLRNAPFGSRCCISCDNASYESTNHMIMQCPFNEGKQAIMLHEIGAVYPDLDLADTFSVLMGKSIEGCSMDTMVQVWKISCKYITQIYYDVLNAIKRHY